MTPNDRGALLLLSGGVDSTALAAICRPEQMLFIDYGQRPAEAEQRAATQIARLLGLSLTTLNLDLRPLGGGLLLNEQARPDAPSPEWWPYRNQFLVTAGAAIALQRGLSQVLIGTVLGDGDRHADGTAAFYAALNELLRLQEGNMSVAAPGIDRTTEELVAASGLGADVLGWTVSCHRSNLPCGDCPGCWKRARVLRAAGIQP